MSSLAGVRTPWLAPWHAAGSALLILLAGCGAQYRPVVTPITPTGPASQPSAYFVAISAPSPTVAGLVTIVNAFGDTVVAQATLSNGPFSFNLNSSGTSGFNINSDATVAGITSGLPGSFVLNSYGISVGTSTGGGLRTQNISTSTIPTAAFPFNAFSTSTGLYLIEPYVNPALINSPNAAATTGTPSVAELTGTIPALQQEIPVAPNPVNFAGASAAPRIYTIAQGCTVGVAGCTTGPLVTPNACSTPASVTTPGEADALELTTNTISNRLPLGNCPVYGIMSPDFLRAYILNRGSGTITVINSQTNALDGSANTANGTPGSTITVGGGPIYADLYAPSSLLVTANYDSDSVSVINVPTDIFSNDGPTFGTANGCPAGVTSGAGCAISLKTASSPSGKGPIAVTILRDGSRAYVANQNDCSVSVVNLTSFVVTKTISLGSNSCHPKAIASVYSTPYSVVYVASADSNVLTAINTETDTVSSSIQLPGNAVTVLSTTQNAATSVNSIVNSNATGLGVPCAASDTSPFCTAVE